LVGVRNDFGWFVEYVGGVREMRMYLVVYDNGYSYSDNENYPVAIFETFKKAKDFCLSKGYKETKIEEYFKCANGWNGERSLEIQIVELNQIINDVD
jgi:hypothetical protein